MAKKPQNQTTVKKTKKSPEDSLRDFWLKKLRDEERINKPHRDKARKVIDRYRDETRKDGSQFNILWANDAVLKGALYSATPKPDVRRRFLDDDPVSRETASVIERGLSFTMDAYDFDGTANTVISDYLLPGYGQGRVRYKPFFEKVEPFPVPVQQIGKGFQDATGEEVDKKDIQEIEQQDPNTGEIVIQQVVFRDERKVYEETTFEPVPWDRFRWEPGKTRWEDVTWACIDHYLNREQLKDQFGDVGAEVEFTHAPPNAEDKGDKNLALVHEIFNKRKRKVIVVSEGFQSGVMKEWDDPLNLKDFYPFPKPLFATQTTGELMPLPDFHFYQDQADELDTITGRIDALVGMLKVRGVYDSGFKDLVNVLRSEDGAMTPVKDFTARFQGKTSLESVMAFMPINEVAQVLAGLYQQREAIKQTIYEITGIADIVRGQSNAAETLGAQQLKGRFADMRLSTRRSRVDAFFRDVLRIKAEIIAEQFSADTLKIMTGSEITPEMDQILKSDVLRAYKIDIETESTMAVDAEEEQRTRGEALSALTVFLEKAIPAVQAGFLDKELAKELALFVIRGFKKGRQLEDIIERLGASDKEGNNPEQLQQEIAQLTQQNQQMGQQLQQGQQVLQDLQKQIESKQVEEQGKAERETQKQQADIIKQREKLESDERRDMREQISEQRRQDDQQRFEQLMARLSEGMADKGPAVIDSALPTKLESLSQTVDKMAQETQKAIESLSNAVVEISNSTPESVDIERDNKGKMLKLVPKFAS